MVKHYNSNLYLFYTVCNSIYGILIFYYVLDSGLSKEALGTSVLSVMAAMCRLASLVVIRKPTYLQVFCERNTESVLGWLQAFFPVLVSVSVSLRLWTLLMRGPCIGLNLDPIHLVYNSYAAQCGILIALLL